VSEVRIFLGALSIPTRPASHPDGDTMRDDERPMALALAEADEAAAAGEVPVGCVIVDAAARVLGRGRNARESLGDPTAHAEVLAIRSAAKSVGGWRLEGTTAYVTLEPCAMCAGALVLARVSRVVFGCADPKGGAVSTMFGIGQDSRLNHRFDVTEGVLREACALRLQRFFAKLRAESL
jgi:tRNA(adenine34) deaminase